MLDLSKFDRFKDQDCKLIKTGSKRPGSKVDVRQYETGDMSLVEIQNKDGTVDAAVMVVGRGFHLLRTSPVVAIVSETDNSISFETEGGFYTLEFLGPVNTVGVCNDCDKDVKLEEMTLKMGGLLCPGCRVILFDKQSREHLFELMRRRAENAAQ